MSLNWRFTDKVRFDALTPEERDQNACFVWGCMFVDIGEITEENAEEWFERYVIANKATGPFYYSDAKHKIAWVPTLEDVRKRIGLATNVVTKTRGQFDRKIKKMIREDVAKAAGGRP